MTSSPGPRSPGPGCAAAAPAPTSWGLSRAFTGRTVARVRVEDHFLALHPPQFPGHLLGNAERLRWGRTVGLTGDGENFSV